MAGRPWLVDPGTGSYTADNDDRAAFRGTAAHNTVRIDGVDQASPAGLFSWASLPNVKADRWIVGDRFQYFAGHHDGYARLADPVLHRRDVFHLEKTLWMIRDVLKGRQEHLIEGFLHLAPDLELIRQDNFLLARAKAAGDGNIAEAQLNIHNSAGQNWEIEVSSTPFSPAYGLRIAAPLLCIRARLSLPQEHAFLLVPCSGENQPGSFSEIHDEHGNRARAYRYDDAERLDYFFFAEGGGSWNFGSWASDASFLYCGLEDGHLTGFVLLDGSYARWQEKAIVTHCRQVERFEWTRRTDRNPSSSDPAALEYFVGSSLDCPDPVL